MFDQTCACGNRVWRKNGTVSHMDKTKKSVITYQRYQCLHCYTCKNGDKISEKPLIPV